jgi:hypothetical protein
MRPNAWLYIDNKTPLHFEFFLITTNHITLTLFSNHFAHTLLKENHLKNKN